MDDLLNGKVEAAGPEMTSSALKIVNHFKEIDALAKDYTVPCAEWAAELYEVNAQIKKLQERGDKLKEVAKQYKDRGTFIHGGYALKLTEKAGAKTLDKDALFKRLSDELGEAEAKVYFDSAMKTGKPSLAITVEKISQ
jgi:DNA repair ATPase RecN